MSADWAIELVRDRPSLDRVAQRCLAQDEIAVDIEADGLFVFRPRLCCMQIAWREGEASHVAIIDTLAVDPAGLSNVLGPEGPAKVLHDLTFDARMLDEAGVSLRHVHDTSVAARLLGHPATGLASLLESLFGVALDKGLQQHNWGKRPLTDSHIEYLAGDVAHLLLLHRKLQELVREQGIVEEVAEECTYKLAMAIAPPRDLRPPYTRIKGANGLEPLARAVLRRLVDARARIAEEADLPPFKIIDNATLLEIARRRPETRRALDDMRGCSGRAARYAQSWLGAVRDGVADGDIPEGDQVYFERRRPGAVEVSQRRKREAQLSAWRRDEAKRRSISEQAVLPGHCAQDLLALMLDPSLAEEAFLTGLSTIPGIGAGRLARYSDAWARLRRAVAAEESVPPPA